MPAPTTPMQPNIKKQERITITDLFSVEINDAKKYPLNVKFEYLRNDDINKKGKGRGVYVILYKRKIVYIGKRKTKVGGVVSSRCLKHLQTFTSRSDKLGLGESQTRQDWCAYMAIREGNQDGFYGCINNAGIEEDHFNKRDPQTTLNRIRFSERHWDEFGKQGDISNILNNFEIWWFKVGPFEGGEDEDAEGIVKHVETQLICKYLPECNNEFHKVIQIYEDRCNNATTSSLTKEINGLIEEFAPGKDKRVVTDDSFVIHPGCNT